MEDGKSSTVSSSSEPTGVKDDPAPTQKAASHPAVPTGVASAQTHDGPNGPFPPELNRWNWGAFLLNWLWGIFHSVWISLIILAVGWIPFIGGAISLGVAIYLGLKGNELAWKNRKFENIEQFKAVQKAWTRMGVIILIISIVLGIFVGIFAFSGMRGVQERAYNACLQSKQATLQQGGDTANIPCKNNNNPYSN